jgi:hypothetical protein
MMPPELLLDFAAPKATPAWMTFDDPDNSSYWLGKYILSRPSCAIRLDPLRLAPEGTLERAFYAMWVYGEALDWDRILALRQPEMARWMRDESVV